MIREQRSRWRRRCKFLCLFVWTVTSCHTGLCSEGVSSFMDINTTVDRAINIEIIALSAQLDAAQCIIIIRLMCLYIFCRHIRCDDVNKCVYSLYFQLLLFMISSNHNNTSIVWQLVLPTAELIQKGFNVFARV